jgi:hypothetical protein
MANIMPIFAPPKAVALIFQISLLFLKIIYLRFCPELPEFSLKFGADTSWNVQIDCAIAQK